MSRSRDFTRKRKVSEDLQTTSIHTLAASQQSVNSTSSSSSDPLSRHASSSTSADVSNSVFIASTHPSPEILTTGASSVLPSYLRPTLQLSVFPLEGIASSAVHTPQGVSQGSSEGEEGTRLPFRALPVTSLTEEEGEKIVCETFSSCKRQRMDISSEIPSAYSRSSSSVNGINGLTRRSNGDAFCNRDDVSSPFPFIPSISPLERWEGLPRRELILLILQCLDGLGYKQTSRMLESESGVPLELPPITHLRQAILTGDWLDVFKILLQLSLEESVIQAMKFLVIEQKFLELMYHQHIEEAVECLRGEFQDACFDTETSNRLKSCCSFLMCQNSEDLQKRSHWSYEGSRTILLSRLQQLFPPDLVPPPKRLNSLLKQAWKYQELHCLYHTHSVDKKYPLLLDHECPKGGVPKHKISVLDRHTDEVWDVAVSNSAKYIASASKDRTIILWDACPPYKKLMTWTDHSAPVGCVVWSPDDRWLASASNDCTVLIWSPTSPFYKWKFSHHKSCVASVCWLPDSRHLVSAEVEKKMALWKLCFPYNTHELVHEWEFGCRLQDCVVTCSGKFAVLVATDDTLRVIDLETKEEVWCLPETDSITSISASTLSDQILVNVCDPKTEITLWDLNMKHIVQKYVGHQQRLYAVRSAFGGPNESFVLCGCEDNQVYIWQRYRGSLLEIISGHTGTVNAVIWPCKTNFSLMISASDDHTLVLWHFDEHFKEDFPINAKTDKSSDAALENADAADIAVDSSHWIAL